EDLASRGDLALALETESTVLWVAAHAHRTHAFRAVEWLTRVRNRLCETRDLSSEEREFFNDLFKTLSGILADEKPLEAHLLKEIHAMLISELGDEREHTLALPATYTDPKKTQWLLPAGSNLRIVNEKCVIDAVGAAVRTETALIIAERATLPVPIENGQPALEFACELPRLFSEGNECSALLTASRLDGYPPDDPQVQLRCEHVRLATQCRLELTSELDTRFYGSPESFDAPVTSPVIRIARLNVRTSPRSPRRDVFELDGVTLAEGRQVDLALGTSDLRVLDNDEDELALGFATTRLSGTIAGYDADAQGLSSLEIAVGRDGSLASLSLANPSTVSLTQDQQTLAVTDGRFRLGFDESGAPVVNIDALKASVREGDELLGVELGRLSLLHNDDRSGQMQITGKSLRGTYAGTRLAGDDVGVEVLMSPVGRAQQIFASGRAISISDPCNTLLAHEASVQVNFDSRQRFCAVHHEAGLSELSTTETGTITLRGRSSLELQNEGSGIRAIEFDSEELTWSQPDGTQLELRDAVGEVALSLDGSPERALLDSGALAWRGSDGVEVTTFGLGGMIEFTRSSDALETVAGVQGMTIRTQGGVAQVDRGTLKAFYLPNGEFSRAKIDAQRAEYFASFGGTFLVEDGELSIRSKEGGGNETTFDASEVRHQNGADQMALFDTRVTLTQDSSDESCLDAVVGAGSVETREADSSELSWVRVTRVSNSA
ncbi:MAG: hypothetical protein AAFQ82_16820, partial [Myxococcota bacterium]